MLVGKLRLAGGGTVHVVASGEYLPNDPEEVFKPELDEATGSCRRWTSRPTTGGDLLTAIHMIDQDLRTLKLVEMALDLVRPLDAAAD